MTIPHSQTLAEHDHEGQLRKMNEALLVSSTLQHELVERAEHAEQAAQMSERITRHAREYAEAILRTSPVPLLVLHSDLRVLTANDAFYQKFEVEPSETAGTLIYKLGNGQWNIPKLRELLEEIIPRYLWFQHFEITHEFEHIGRRTMLLNARRMAVANGGQERIVLVIEDITDRKAIEDALRESEERYRSLFESIDEGFCVIEMLYDGAVQPVDYRFLKVNPAFEKHTGLTNPVGKTILELVPNHEEHWFEIFGKVVATGEAVRFVKRGEGMQRWFDVYAFRLEAADSRKVAILFTDITQRKASEEALRDADRRKDEFLATLAHELRNPLATLSYGLDLLGLTNGREHVFDEIRELMERQLGQLVRLIDDLMDVSRISRGKIELRKTRVELASVLNQAMEASCLQTSRGQHDIQMKLPREVEYVEGDAVRLGQIFGNLINNACKYTPGGGTIWITAERRGRELLVSVKDTGVGIAAEKLDSIFGLFTQIDTSLERAQGGLGIGLTLVKQLVELHGGTITAHSDGMEKGSEFIVRLPIASSEEREATVDAVTQRDSIGTHPASTAAPARRVLVVDDNRDAAQSLALVLKLTKSEIHVAHDGAEAIAMAQECRPDLILLDLGLPNIDGYDACRKIRRQPWGKEITIIALTGWGQDKDRRKTEDAGFDGHLVKPVEYATLVKLLNEPATAASGQ